MKPKQTWTGHPFDFQGECDLVLADAPHFADGLGMTVHIRTKIRYSYSYVESAIIRIGNDILQGTFDRGIALLSPTSAAIRRLTFTFVYVL